MKTYFTPQQWNELPKQEALNIFNESYSNYLLTCKN